MEEEVVVGGEGGEKEEEWVERWRREEGVTMRSVIELQKINDTFL